MVAFADLVVVVFVDSVVVVVVLSLCICVSVSVCVGGVFQTKTLIAFFSKWCLSFSKK